MMNRVYAATTVIEWEVAMGRSSNRGQKKREPKKPRTAADKGKRYRCCVCRKRAARKTTEVPFYCAEHRYLKDGDFEAASD